MAQGDGYHFAIPKGYSQRSGAELHLPARTLAVGQDQRAAEGYFVASMVVTPVEPSTPPFDPTSAKLCGDVAQVLAKGQDAVVLKSGLVSTPLGQACQVDLKANKSNQAVRFTTMGKAPALWALSCNHDPRDAAALQACQQVIDSWKFD